MGRYFGRYTPAHPWLGKLGYYLTVPAMTALGAAKKFFRPDSRYAQERGEELRLKLARGETAYLLGIGPGGHNSGVALVEVSHQHGVRLITNNEEERYTGVKHCTAYPEQSIADLLGQMERLNIRPDQIHACLASFDYARLTTIGFALEEAPQSLALLRYPTPEMHFGHMYRALTEAPARLGAQLGLGRPMPIIGMRHHDNHAYFSWAVSPFAASAEPVMVAVLDGFGDDGSISLYGVEQGNIELLRSNKSMFDSLGLLYAFISSTQGGWTILSSEGRYMGAAAWGNSDRLTNPYYRRLRQLIYFGRQGQIYLNRALANWQRKHMADPYTSELADILGPPIAIKDMWNPDAVLNVEDIEHAEITRERVDKAAATQLLFEDALFHVVEHLIRTTKSSRLILTGGTALNCIANMRLLDHFNEQYYQRYLGQPGTRLQLWVPPTPGDAGAPMGAAYQFALRYGARPGAPLRHAFYCGSPPETQQIRAALAADPAIESLPLGSTSNAAERELIADLMAYLVAQGGFIGLFQGVAETGPRALGHRSILANPCHPDTRDRLNQHVKFREAVRPLAPMMTLEAAQRWFQLSPGAAADDFNAYNYMILTAPAAPESATVIPAIIHHDGTGRVQIVQQESDPLAHAYLKAMGRRVGVEASVNTSLNVGTPIVQTPQQAIQALKRSKGLHALILVGDDGQTFLAWHNVVKPPKDAGVTLRGWIRDWRVEVGAEDAALVNY